jgi:hypothetical protein
MRRKDALSLAGELEGARVKRAEVAVEWERGRRYEVFVLGLVSAASAATCVSRRRSRRCALAARWSTKSGRPNQPKPAGKGGFRAFSVVLEHTWAIAR